MEYAGGLSRQFGARGAIRVDATYRDFRDFYVQRTDLSTGRVTDTRANIPASVRGRVYDLTLVENSDTLKRRYAGVAAQAQYRVGTAFDTGGSYTLSHLWGNVDGETLNSGPTSSDVLQYPEYKSASWNAPEGDLAADQRHRARLWVNAGVPKVAGLIVSAMEILESGVPYGAVGAINSPLYVANPGYLTPPTATSVTYYYTARDAFRTVGQKRTDFAVSYARRVWGPRHLELFGQFQLLNLFNQYQLCACAASTVFANGGSVNSTRIDQTVRTSVTNGTVYQAFNPFTASAAEGVNWAKGPSFGTALNRFAYTTPRTLRLTFGVRF
jgi:hypothetical protein